MCLKLDDERCSNTAARRTAHLLFDAVALFSVDRDVDHHPVWIPQEVDQLTTATAASSPARTGLDEARVSGPRLNLRNSRQVIQVKSTTNHIMGPFVAADAS